jgi:hypothetical protein
MTIESRLAALESTMKDLRRLAARISLRDVVPPPAPYAVSILSGQFTQNTSTSTFPPTYPFTTTWLDSGGSSGIFYAADDNYTIPSGYNLDPTQDSIAPIIQTYTAPGVWTATGPLYPAGIGNGILRSASGAPLGRVLVRHNWNGFTDPLMAGNLYTAGQPIVVNVFDGSTVQAYPIVGMW